MDEISNTLSEIRDSNQQILLRCNELCEPTCQCEAFLELTRTERHSLRTRVTALENSCKRKVDEVKNLSESIKSLTHQLETIQKTIQTDDAKWRKRNPSPADAQAVCVQEERKTEQVNFDNDASDEDNWFGTKFARKGKDAYASTPRQEGATMTTESVSGSTSDIRTRVEANTGEEDLSQAESVQVDVIKQVRQQVVFGDMHWRNIAQDELNEGQKMFIELQNVKTVLCVDISESMLESSGWEQASAFVRDYLNGLCDMSTLGMTSEHVALVTFGHETAVKQRFSNDYEKLLQVFNTLKVGGPSSLYGGLMLSQAAARSSRFVGNELAGGLVVPTKIIIITDGRPTNINVIAGPDETTSNMEQTKGLIVNELSEHNVVRHDIFVVPVGNVDTEFIDVMVGVSGGLKMDYTHGRRLSRRHYLSAYTANCGGTLQLVQLAMFSPVREPLTIEDQEDIPSIIERSKRFLEINRLLIDPPKECYHEKPRSLLPTIGSRVRRGPDWIWGEGDGTGPGTAIGHAKETDEVWVEWDKTELIKLCRYGETGYDVLIVDEPRELQEGRLLAVGCNVKPGKCWKQAEPKPRRGVVIKLKSTIATVRWDNSRRGEFSADLQEGELEYCPSLERHSEDSELGGTRRETTTDLYTNKRNKNIQN